MGTETKELVYAMKAFKEASAAFAGAEWLRDYAQPQETLDAAQETVANAQELMEQAELAELMRVVSDLVDEITQDLSGITDPEAALALQDALRALQGATSLAEVSKAIRDAKRTLANAEGGELDEDEQKLTLAEKFRLLGEFNKAEKESNERANAYIETTDQLAEQYPDMFSDKFMEQHKQWKESVRKQEEERKAREEAMAKELEAAGDDLEKQEAIYRKYSQSALEANEAARKRDEQYHKQREEELRRIQQQGSPEHKAALPSWQADYREYEEKAKLRDAEAGKLNHEMQVYDSAKNKTISGDVVKAKEQIGYQPAGAALMRQQNEIDAWANEDSTSPNQQSSAGQNADVVGVDLKIEKNSMQDVAKAAEIAASKVKKLLVHVDDSDGQSYDKVNESLKRLLPKKGLTL